MRRPRPASLYEPTGSARGWWTPESVTSVPAVPSACAADHLATHEKLEQMGRSQQCHTTMTCAQSAFFIVGEFLCGYGQAFRPGLDILRTNVRDARPARIGGRRYSPEGSGPCSASKARLTSAKTASARSSV